MSDSVTDALPCGCSASMVAAFGHYSLCSASVSALLAVVAEGAKPKMLKCPKCHHEWAEARGTVRYS